jgi:pimeloyl-ACP methyl ester carboxylesterase
VNERHAEVGGIEVFWREAPSTDGGPPVVYVHGVPTNSDDWVPFLEKTGGLALDLPGFGRSAKPNDFPYTIDGYVGYLDAWLAECGVDRYRLVVHDWGGGLGLVLAQRAPERVDRLVLMNCTPLMEGYHYHRVARAWRTPLLGEVLMGLTFRANLRRSLSRAVPGGVVPDEFLDSIWKHFDHGTQRAILKLYRSAPPDALAPAGENLGAITAPALVAWGDGDPYVGTEFAHRYPDLLGGPTQVEIIPDGRHWSWVNRPQTVDLVASFLLG